SRRRHTSFSRDWSSDVCSSDLLDAYGSQLLRITLLHLTNTAWGTTSAPQWLRRQRGLTDLGYRFIEKMNELRIGVDLAHIHEQRSEERRVGKGVTRRLAAHEPR